MSKNLEVMILNPPSPPCYDVCRDWAGGFGISWYRPRRSDYGQSDNTILQPCLSYLSSVIMQEGYESKVLDCQRLRLNRSQVLKIVAKESPDLIFSLIGFPSLKKDCELLYNIRETLPETFIVGIGTTCRVIPGEVLLHSRLDAILRSDYPYVSSLVNLIEAFEGKKSLKSVHGVSYVKNGKTVSTQKGPELDLNSVPPPSYCDLNPDEYHSSFADLTGEKYQYIPILGSKGCPHGCVYCPYPLGFGTRWTYRSPKNIVDEIEYLHTTYGVKGFLFRDQSFTMNKKHAIELCNEIIQRRLDIAWFCEARVDEVSRELLKKMKAACCKRIHYGVETGDPKLINMGKPRVNLEIIRKAFHLTKEVGLWRTAHVILGWPDESLESLRRTYEFVISLDPDDVNCNTLIPYPGTKLYDVAMRNSWILSNDWTKYTPDAGIMKTKNFSSFQIREAKKKIIRDFLKFKGKKMLLQLARGERKLKITMDDVRAMIMFYFKQAG